MSKIKNFTLDLSTVTTEDLVKTLDKDLTILVGGSQQYFHRKI